MKKELDFFISFILQSTNYENFSNEFICWKHIEKEGEEEQTWSLVFIDPRVRGEMIFFSFSILIVLTQQKDHVTNK